LSNEQTSELRQVTISRRDLLATGSSAAALLAASALLAACGGETPTPAATNTTAPVAAAATNTTAPAAAAATNTTAPAAAAATSTTAPVAAAATNTTDTASIQPQSTPAGLPTNTAVAASNASGSQVIAKIADLQAGEGKDFTIPGSGKPGKLVRLADGSFLAYNALCTHKGCEVSYKKGATDFACPCHGSVFAVTDGAVKKGPAASPLKKLNIKVDEASGTITYEG